MRCALDAGCVGTFLFLDCCGKNTVIGRPAVSSLYCDVGCNLWCIFGVDQKISSANLGLLDNRQNAVEIGVPTGQTPNESPDMIGLQVVIVTAEVDQSSIGFFGQMNRLNVAKHD